MTTNYVPIFEAHKADPEDFVVTVPISEIGSASFFDETVYSDFLEARERESASVGLDTDWFLPAATAHRS